MRKRWLGVMLVVVSLFLVPSPVLAGRRGLDIGGGYGSYNPTLEKVNGFIHDFNSWTQNLFYLSDFELGTLEGSNLLSISFRRKIDPRWEIGLDANYWKARGVSESASKVVRIEGVGAWELSASGNFSASIIFVDCMVYRKFISKSNWVPYVSAGIGYYGLNINGDYQARINFFGPNPHSEYFRESFSILPTVGCVLGGGISGFYGEHLRIDLELKYHLVPKAKGRTDVYDEGFYLLPVESGSFEEDLSGLSVGINLMFSF